ncbi:MAG: carboxypeptidase-like regulatory domain-containing protein, partial [Algoriphagus sp.]
MQGFKESFKAQNFKLDNSCQTNDEDLPGFQNLAGLTCQKTKPTMFFLKRFTFSFLLFIISTSVFSQTKPLIGQVLDSLNRPIAYANVVAINQSTQKIGGFGITNDEGRF